MLTGFPLPPKAETHLPPSRYCSSISICVAPIVMFIYSISHKSAAALLCKKQNQGNAGRRFPDERKCMQQSVLLQSVFHSAGCNAFYEILLCCKEQDHQRHNRNEGHCHNLAPLHDRFRIQRQADRQRNRILLHGVDENQ